MMMMYTCICDAYPYQLPLPECSTCQDPLSRLHVCMHCVYMGCWRKNHMREHMKSKQHNFGKYQLA